MTKTVDGMCADCWGVKEPERAKRWQSRPRREPPVDPLKLLWGGGAVVAAALVLAFLAGRWI